MSLERLSDEAYVSLPVSPQLLAEWHNISYSIFLNLIETRPPANTFVCVPHVITTLEFFAQAASPICRSHVREVIFPGSRSRLLRTGTFASYLNEWTDAIRASSRPGSFNTERRLLYHTKFTKSFSFDTFKTLKSLEIETSIVRDDGRKANLDWLRKSLKMDGLPDRIDPIELWSSDQTPQTVSKQKCPIFIAASHFEIAVKSNVLDQEHVYTTPFHYPKTGAWQTVLASRLCLTTLNPFVATKIGEVALMFALPTSYESLGVYIIDNYDALDIREAKVIEKLVERCHGEGAEKVRPNVKELYIPLFYDFKEQSTNVGSALNSAVQNMDRLFQPDSFGDLACEGGEPSTSARCAGSIQHYDSLELMRLPDLASPVPAPPKSDSVFIVDEPFAVIVWDRVRSVSLYFGRIGAPDVPRLSEQDASKESCEKTSLSSWRLSSILKSKRAAKAAEAKRQNEVA